MLAFKLEQTEVWAELAGGVVNFEEHLYKDESDDWFDQSC